MSHIENNAATSLVTTAETVIATGNAVVLPGSVVNVNTPTGIPTLIRGVLNVTTGTGTTALSVRCRAGINAVAGATVGANPLTTPAAASTTVVVPFEFFDAAGVSSGYTITLQQVGATGNATMINVSLNIEPE